MTTMKRNRHTPEQAVRKVREGERMLGSGSDLTEVLRHLEIIESTWHRWRQPTASMPTASSQSSSASSPNTARQHTCGWTTAPNSSPRHCGTGVASGAPTPPTSSPARPGRTPTSSPSTDACETSASTQNNTWTHNRVPLRSIVERKIPKFRGG